MSLDKPCLPGQPRIVTWVEWNHACLGAAVLQPFCLGTLLRCAPVSMVSCSLSFPFRPREGSKENSGGRSKRALEEEEGSMEGLSKNKLKKQLRNPHKTFDPSLKRECYSC